VCVYVKFVCVKNPFSHFTCMVRPSK